MRLLVEHPDVSNRRPFCAGTEGSHASSRGEGRMRAKRKPADQNWEFASSDQINS
jgi:hypothetical protein